jgi:hypothetical protein
MTRWEREEKITLGDFSVCNLLKSQAEPERRDFMARLKRSIQHSMVSSESPVPTYILPDGKIMVPGNEFPSQKQTK